VNARAGGYNEQCRPWASPRLWMEKAMYVHVPAMRGRMGSRTYYACLMPLDAVPNLFKFTDWYGILPEDREQRVLNEKRIPDLKNYILENEDDYLFSSITASYKSEPIFEPFQNGADSTIGVLKLRLGDELVINDGQHRAAGITAAIRENPKIGEHTISVLLFPWETKDRVQQMFSDLNRYVQKTSKSLDILFDQRDDYAMATRAFLDRVPLFKELTEMEDMSLKSKSPKIFTLAALYDANRELLKGRLDDDILAYVDVLTQFWAEVAKHMPDWEKVLNGQKVAVEFRAQRLSSHSTVLRALGGIGGEIMKNADWRQRLSGLEAIDWSKKNSEWDNICIVANSVVSNRQARAATKAFIKSKLGVDLTDAEKRMLTEANPKVTSAPAVSNGVKGIPPVFVVTNRRHPGLLAKARPALDGRMTVLKGSTSKTAVESSLSDGDREFRDLLIRQGKLRQTSDELLEFVEDVDFDSSSSAASIVNTCSRNGPEGWMLDGSNLTLGQWMKQNDMKTPER
jgi:DNA sulfur modification protein DndB